MDKKTAKICGNFLVSGGAAAFGGAFVLPVMMYVLNFSDLWVNGFGFYPCFSNNRNVFV